MKLENSKLTYLPELIPLLSCRKQEGGLIHTTEIEKLKGDGFILHFVYKSSVH